MMRSILIALAVLYALACLVALIVAGIGVFGRADEPLAAVYAIVLAMPWSMLIGTISGFESPLGNFVLLILFMAVNLAVLIALERLAGRRRS